MDFALPAVDENVRAFIAAVKEGSAAAANAAADSTSRKRPRECAAFLICLTFERSLYEKTMIYRDRVVLLLIDTNSLRNHLCSDRDDARTKYRAERRSVMIFFITYPEGIHIQVCNVQYNDRICSSLTYSHNARHST